MRRRAGRLAESGRRPGVRVYPREVQDEPTIRIASLNLWGRFGSWERRLERLAERWPELGADLLLVQEACLDRHGDQLLDLGEALGLPERLAFYPHGCGEGVGVLSAHPLQEKRSRHLPGSGFPRVMVAVRLTRPFALEVIAAHLSFHPPADNAAQLEAVLEAARAASGPVVAGGDFNIAAGAVEAAAPDFEHALAGVAASWPVIELAELEAAWRERTGDGLPDDFDATPRRLDHLLGRGLASPKSGREIIEGFDHALVWADFKAPRA